MMQLAEKGRMVTPVELLHNDPNNIFFRCVEDSFESIMITDVAGKLVYVNQAWQNIYGFSWDEAIGQTPRILRSTNQDETAYKKMWQQILDPKIGYWRGELLNKNKFGKEVPVLLTVTPFRQNGEIEGYMGIALDMTEKKAMEAEILRQDRLASVGLLASGVAHEVGTPLGVIRARAELMLMQNSANEAVKENTQTIIKQIDRVSQLVTNLLKLSRGDNQPGDHAQISQVVEEAVSLISQKLRKYNIELINNIPRTAKVKIGHNKLEQVYLNLLVNSIHAISEEHKKGNVQNHKIVLDYCEKGRSACLSVRDTGCGIEKHNLSNLFKPFFTTKDIGEGTGLGLSISYQLINEAGGDMKADSILGQGSSFDIILPLVFHESFSENFPDKFTEKQPGSCEL